MSNDRIHEFTEDTRGLLLSLISWFWKTFEERGFLDFGVTIEDYKFLFSLWENGVIRYNDKQRDKLNSIRDIYLKMKK